ncbi:sigma-70 family RNA polymerase sigma factor [Rubellimicrobium arenae]|uniref:sigma-70 family RNA polymerase sigma factor n=1 Tax=Rubellimicrobium arenae TaxID=2817372 RepID=UPI0034A519CB
MTIHTECPIVPPQLSSFDRDVLALQPALCAFARRLLRQEADVEDLVQETILKALAARDRFHDGTNLKAWLFTIMRNSFNTRWRKARRETTPGAEAIEQSATTPATQATDLWAREAIGRLLNDLSPAHREILILIPVLGLGYEDAAEVCNCSVGTIKSRLNRARAALAGLVDGDRP